MPDLLVTQALPNPAGKDRPKGHVPSNDQINGEWIEFQNVSDGDVSLKDVYLTNIMFDQPCQSLGERRLINFAGILASGQAFRVHTGSGTEWQEGPLTHVYLGRDSYVWNNECGDIVRIRRGNDAVDRAFEVAYELAYRRGFHHGFVAHRDEPTVTEPQIVAWRASPVNRSETAPPGCAGMTSRIITRMFFEAREQGNVIRDFVHGEPAVKLPD
jgi:hypothetical protein